jgi:hypothetical protein
MCWKRWAVVVEPALKKCFLSGRFGAKLLLMAFDVKPGRGSERVKAWLYAIMNPLIDSFRREAELLRVGNLSWRVHSRRCEYIRPVTELVDFDQRPNLEDFLAENPTFRERFAEHDSGVMAVEEATALFVRDLLATLPFQQRVAQYRGDYEASERSSNPSLPDLSDLSSKIPDYIAEFIVNNTMSLPGHYTLYPFWVAYATKFEDYFLSFRESPAATAAQKLTTTSEQLSRNLEALRLDLCREYDIPAAPIEPPRGVSVENVLFR